MPLTLTPDEAREITWGGNADYKTITSRITGKKRWQYIEEMVFQHMETGTFYRFTFLSPATEVQEDSKPFEDEKEIQPEVVAPVTREVTVYELI